MSCIIKRTYKSGHIAYQVQFRRKGMKTFSSCFSNRLSAETFSLLEAEWVKDPETFKKLHLEGETLRRVIREIKRNGEEPLKLYD